MRFSRHALCAIAVIATSCGGEVQLDEFECPSAGTDLDYDTFGRAFFDRWCQSCHASGAQSRGGAPLSVTFDDLDSISRQRDRIYARAAGPNTTMPPGSGGPTDDDREALAEWLACGDF